VDHFSHEQVSFVGLFGATFENESSTNMKKSQNSVLLLDGYLKSLQD